MHSLGKQRGRPAGSKNKPKPITASTTEPTAAEEPTKFAFIHVPEGEDAIESIVELARREHVSVTVLGGSGAVASVTLSHTPGGATGFTLHGPFSLVSFSGTYVYSNHYTLNPGASPPPRMALAINLCTSEGQIFGGTVGGKVIAAEDVTLTVSTFKNPEVYKFHPEEDNNNNGNNNNNNNVNNADGGAHLSAFNTVPVW
ncbi:AT-hook motif nuclear-localized protein 17 [Cajanus cajan]|uniref:AT-hook motif nuclear-localized protein 17 n=1 Tax=Cajanus cajan TaxID=3821 RepID=UPI00098D7936|nr:AT-hook motif nuclear-localized protein 17 [Cajanus cajan]